MDEPARGSGVKRGLDVGTALRRSLPLVALALCVIALNARVPAGEFLNWDDTLLVTENPRVQPHGLSGLLRALNPSDALSGRHLEYLPLRDLAYALIFYYRGLDPVAYHVAQIVVHLCVCLLVFWCARPWIRERGALIAASLFAVHPVHVESVAWIASLKDPTFTAAVLLSVGLYFRSTSATGRSRALLYAGALLAMVVALGFKQIAIVTPALLWAVDWAFTERRARARALSIAPFALLALAVLPLFLVIGSRNGVIVPPPGGTRLTGLLTMTVVYARYLGTLVAPFDLSARYVLSPVLTVADSRFIVSAVVIAAAWAVAAVLRTRTRAPLLVLLWFTIALLPVMNIIPIPIEMADRYLYLPSVGFAIGCGAGIDALVDRTRPAIAALVVAATVGIMALWGALSVERSAVWHDDVVLWSSVIEHAPQFYLGRTNLAMAYLRRGDHVAAERQLRAALAISPDDPVVHLNLGMLFRAQRRSQEAKESFRRAIALRPIYPKAYNNLASVFMDEHDWAGARPLLERALELDREYPTAHRNLAVVCMNLSDHAGALAHMRAAIDVRPSDRQLLLEWLDMLRAARRESLAVDLHDRIERLFATDAEIWQRYAEVLARAGFDVAATDARAHAAKLQKP